jgi:hypothetical protein
MTGLSEISFSVWLKTGFPLRNQSATAAMNPARRSRAPSGRLP